MQYLARTVAIGTLCTFLPSVLSFAADAKLHAASGDPDRLTTVFAQFETPVPGLKDCDVEFPSSCNPTAPWIVVVYLPSGLVLNDAVKAAVVTHQTFSARGDVALTLDKPVTGYRRIDVTFTKGKVQTSASFDSAGKPKKKLATPSKTKDDSDVYISGSVSSAVGSSPTYLIDSKGKYTLYSFGNNGDSTLSLTGDISTDNRPTADPDSFHWAIPYQHVSSAAIYNWSLIGMELNKKASALNLVSAPGITRTLLNHAFLRTVSETSDAVVKAAIGLDITGGIELGDNLRNQFAVVNKSSNGEGFFLRGAPSANAYLIIPKFLGLTKCAVSSSYIARIPTTDELFLETLHQKTPVPILTSKTRHYVENNVQFMISPYVGINIKHQYGSLPPAFSFVDNKVSVGFVLAFKQTRTPGTQ